MTIPILNQQLKKLRLDAGLTQVQLAQLLGVEQPTVSVIEKGGNTSIVMLQSWVSACNGRITLIPADTDPWKDIPEAQRRDALEVARLWCVAPEAIQASFLMTLRALKGSA